MKSEPQYRTAAVRITNSSRVSQPGTLSTPPGPRTMPPEANSPAGSGPDAVVPSAELSAEPILLTQFHIQLNRSVPAVFMFPQATSNAPLNAPPSSVKPILSSPNAPSQPLMNKSKSIIDCVLNFNDPAATTPQ